MGRVLHSRSNWSVLAVLAAAVLFLWEPCAAQMSDGGGLSRSSGSSRSSSSRSSGSRELGSSRSSSSRSGRTSSRGDEDFDDGGDEDSGSRSRSSNRRSSGSRSGGSGGGTRSFSTGGSGKGGGSTAETPPIVFGSKFERDGVRPRGTLLSVATFEALPCEPEPVSVGAEIYYRCGAGWFQRIEHEGWTCYSEIWPPAGAHISSLPSDHLVFHSGPRTLYASENAWFEQQHGGYIVIEPPVGLEVDRLPQGAKSGIPVLVNGVTYYRHLGVFYRQQAGGLYVVAASPFSPQPVAPATSGTPPGNSLDAAGATTPFVPREPFPPMPSTPPADLAPPSVTPSYDPAAAPVLR